MRKVMMVVLFVSTIFLSMFGLQKNVTAQDKGTPKKEVYTIALDSTFAPFEFQNENGEYVGIDVDLIDAIAKEEGFTIRKVFPGFQAAVDQVQAGQADGMIAAMSITQERKKSFDFSEPYYDSNIKIAVAKKNEDQLKNLSDLKGKVVGVKNGTSSQTWLVEHQKEYGYTLKAFDDGSIMYDSLAINAVFAIMDDGPVLDYAVQQGKDLATPLTPEPAGQYGFAVKKDTNSELIEMFNNGLKKLKANGDYERILSNYIGVNATSGTSENTHDETTIVGLIQTNWISLANGLWRTVLMALAAFVLATIVGIVFGLFSVAPSRILRTISTIYVDILRGVPLMVLAFFIFYGLPQMIHGFLLNDFVAGILALTLNASAYISEIVRGGINAVPKGQMEAARSLGLGYIRTMQKIILPQAIKMMLPSFVNQFVISLKDTTIISVLGVVELLQAGKIIVARNLQSFNVYLIIGVMYLIVITILTKLSKLLEKRVSAS